jgi:predicted nucleotide-binding protein (sugar kinase/HSP70/actin superfamily)
MAQAITKLDLHEALKETTREIIGHFNKSQGEQNRQIDARFDAVDQRFDGIDQRLDEIGDDVSKIKLAVVDLMGTDRHMHNLVHELKGQNIKLDEAKIFTS